MPRDRAALTGVLALAFAASSCTPVDDVFSCDDDAQCRIGQAQGRCEPSGHCSLPAIDCPSGYRYDGSASPALAGTCALDVDCDAPFTVQAGAIAAACVEDAPPTIDGDLTDWPEAALATTITHATADAAFGTWSADEVANDADLSAVVGWRWDARYLYVAARITDDRLLVTDYDPMRVWNNDALELFLDGAGDRSGPYAPDDYQLIVRYDGVAGAARGGPTIAVPEGLRVAVATIASTRWTVEIGFPLALLGGAPVEPGRMLAVDLQLPDRDSTTGDFAQALTWKKDTSNPPACSATCTTECKLACSTIHFAPLQLGGR